VRGIAKGELITTSEFGQYVTAPGAGLQIPPGHNAVTMSVAAPQGMANYAQPGDIVDVYVTLKQQTETITKLLLSNVQVLSNHPAGMQSSQNGATSTGEVMLTLALTPDQAERVIFAKENGSLWFGLVRPGDKPTTTIGRTANNELQ